MDIFWVPFFVPFYCGSILIILSVVLGKRAKKEKESIVVLRIVFWLGITIVTTTVVFYLRLIMSGGL